MTGDFRQCLPVVPKGTRSQIVASTIVYAPFWKDVKVMVLRVNMRVLGQAAIMTPEEHAYTTQFAAWQLKVGDGSANDDGISMKLPPGTIS
jgi:ATP-dependent DNA helicase PIF1